jgi:2-keto-4-pentenoate hydratase/2-oxohepta-3-ene-1,7-dioic acid hydratase in catechol pathway
MNAGIPSTPVFFLKPETAILRDGNDFYYPEFTKNLQYECEIVIRIDKTGKYLQSKFAHKYFSSVSLGIDFTARDLQQYSKENSLPWEIGKAFDNSAPISNTFLPIADVDLRSLSFKLLLNGKTVQSGNTRDMIFSVDEIIAYVSRFITLKPGDLIFTGTPQGVGPIEIGDQLEGFIENQKMFHFKIN